MKKLKYDRYPSFEALTRENTLGIDYQIQGPEIASQREWLIAAPHGGRIESGTTEIAKAISSSIHSFYSFGGLKKKGNFDLHITSSNFDEPTFLNAAQKHQRILGIHGCEDNRAQNVHIWVGGGCTLHQEAFVKELNSRGFSALEDLKTAGRSKNNICNRGIHPGIQLELAKSFRVACFHDPKTRQHPTELFTRFVEAVGNIISSA